MPKVPLNDLGRSLQAQRVGLLEVMDRVLSSGWLVHGPEHRAFEGELAAFLGVGHVVGVASGTDALELAMRALMTPRRRTVVTVANAGAYASVAARSAGADVRYCDVQPSTHCIDPDFLAEVLDESVFAVVVTHLYGRVADVERIVAACAPLGVRVIEDCAQSFGAETDRGRAGSLGDVATFSFYPTKNLGAIGDGGAVATDDAAVADRVRRLRQYGWGAKYRIDTSGGRNSRLDELQAAVLRFRMPLVEEWNQRRREIIGRYEAASGPRVRVLEARGRDHVGHLAVVETEDAGALAQHLAERGVGTDVHYPVPDHHQPAFAGDFVGTRLPETERLVGRILSLPCFPELTDDEIETVCGALESF